MPKSELLMVFVSAIILTAAVVLVARATSAAWRKAPSLPASRGRDRGRLRPPEPAPKTGEVDSPKVEGPDSAAPGSPETEGSAPAAKAEAPPAGKPEAPKPEAAAPAGEGSPPTE